MILTSNLVLQSLLPFIWHQIFHIMASCSHFVTSSAFFNSFCWFPTSIKKVHQDLDYFKTLFWEKKLFLIFFFLPFFSMKDCYEIEINILSVQNIASVNFQKVCCSTRPSSQTKGENSLVLGCGVMSAILQRCQDWMNEIYNYWCEMNNLNL